MEGKCRKVIKVTLNVVKVVVAARQAAGLLGCRCHKLEALGSIVCVEGSVDVRGFEGRLDILSETAARQQQVKNHCLKD